MKICLNLVAACVGCLSWAGAAPGADVGSTGAWIVERRTDGEPMRLGSVFPKSPAEKAGVKPGWYVISVNGTNVVRMPSPEVLRMVRGSPGTVIKLDLADPTRSHTNRVTVKRGKAVFDDYGSLVKIIDP